MVILASDPLFAEIPEHLRLQMNDEAQEAAFTILQMESVAAGDLSPDPQPSSQSLAGRSLSILLQLLLGCLCGLIAVLAVQWLLRSLAVLLS